MGELRAARVPETVSGVGGCLEIYRRYGVQQNPRVPGSLLDIGQWELEHIYRSVELPLSGGYGAVTELRTATACRWRAMAAWDRSTAEAWAHGRGQVAIKDDPFLDTHLQGMASADPTESDDFTVGIAFHLGDPSFYPRQLAHPEATEGRGAFLYLERASLQTVRLLNVATADGVVLAFIEGKGASPLRRYYGETWHGTGGLGMGLSLEPVT